jgi:hypothetical protein
MSVTRLDSVRNETGDGSASDHERRSPTPLSPFDFAPGGTFIDGELRRDEKQARACERARRAPLMRDLIERLRATVASLGHLRRDESNDECGQPWMLTLDSSVGATEDPLVPPPRPRPPAPPLKVASVESSVAAGDPGLVPALYRVADAFEKIAGELEADRRERGVRLDAVEALVRELVSGLSQPSSVPPIVVGGTIDLSDPPSELEDPSLSGRAGVDGGVDTA